MTTSHDDVPANFKGGEVRHDAFGTLYVKDGKSFRVFSGTPTRDLPLKSKYLAKTGNPSIKQ